MQENASAGHSFLINRETSNYIAVSIGDDGKLMVFLFYKPSCNQNYIDILRCSLIRAAISFK